MDLQQKFEVREEGDANFYRILSDKDCLCRIQMNGELTDYQQKELLAKIVVFLNHCKVIDFREVITKELKNDSTGNN